MKKIKNIFQKVLTFLGKGLTLWGKQKEMKKSDNKSFRYSSNANFRHNRIESAVSVLAAEINNFCDDKAD